MKKALTKPVTIIKPLVTEKATLLNMNKEPVYSFIVAPGANKQEVAKAVKEKYKVEPTKVAVINLPRTKVMNRRKPGFRPGMRKALVYLPVGTTIKL
ncbi:MAG: 50S ribosomal protein L23 [Candidatus Pacebacteria bacterium]|nr:50S ribosomal protein L23 [Candidatus Paceibacterota bacterium]